MRHFLLFFLFLCFQPHAIHAKSHTLKAGITYLDAAKLKILPGDTLFIEGGERRFLQLKNLTGDSLHPIVIINKGEVIINNSDFYYGFKLHNCQYVKLTGTGKKGLPFGFKITGTGPKAPGLNITGISTDFEIDHIEVTHAGFAGIMSKSDPSCDHSTNRENFTQKNVSFHHNYIHDVGGEGFYVGNSFFRGFAKSRKCMGDTLYPHEIWNLKIYNNTIENTAWEGIQIGCASKNARVFNNRIKNFGLQNKKAQNNGLQIGEGTTGIFYSNVIEKGNGNGIIILGQGQILIYNNYIGHCSASGIFCDNRTISKDHVIAVFNNTIEAFGMNGIRWFNEDSKNIFTNNLIINGQEDETSFFLFHPSDIKQESENNLTGTSYQSLNVVVNQDGFLECNTTYENLRTTQLLGNLLEEYNLTIHDRVGALLKSDIFN